MLGPQKHGSLQLLYRVFLFPTGQNQLHIDLRTLWHRARSSEQRSLRPIMAQAAATIHEGTVLNLLSTGLHDQEAEGLLG